jgi:hypothetical protein
MGPSQTGCRLKESTRLAEGGTVSERNGDKARFGRQRKRRIFERKRTRELRKALVLEDKTTRTTSAQSK